MIRDIPIKLNLYDQFGYLMVGAVFLLLLIFDTVYFFQVNIPPFYLDTFLAWFVVTYFTGHLIQGTANIITKAPFLHSLVKEDKSDFTDDEKIVLNQVGDYLSVKEADDSKLWRLCLTLTTAKDVTGQVGLFNAYYSLYRGWFVILLLQSMFLAYHILFLGYSTTVLLFFLLSVFLAFVVCKRSKRFWQYLRSKALETFIVVKAKGL